MARPRRWAANSANRRECGSGADDQAGDGEVTLRHTIAPRIFRSMHHLGCHHLGRPSRLALLCAAAILLAQASAQADCGDYVVIGSQAAQAGKHLRMMGHTALPKPAGLPRACTGPSCSALPPLEPAPLERMAPTFQDCAITTSPCAPAPPEPSPGI